MKKTLYIILCIFTSFCVVACTVASTGSDISEYSFISFEESAIHESVSEISEESIGTVSESSVETSSDSSSEISAENSTEISDIVSEVSEEISIYEGVGEAWLNGSVVAKNAFVYDLNAEEFLYEKNTGVNITPASVTKLLTALYALENAPTDMVITPGSELSLLNPHSSVAGIKSAHTLTLEQLIIGLLLPSGNDCAYTIAVNVARHVTGNTSLGDKEALDYFMSELNKYGEKLGCTDTHFTVPDGLAGEEHYTTAHDLVIIASAALENETIAKYISTPQCKFAAVSGHIFTWNNSNQFLHEDSEYYSPYVTGLKTGTLRGYTILISANINGNTYIIGVFASDTHQNRYNDAEKLLNNLINSLK